MFNWFSKAKNVLGIDIGTADLKVAQISHGPGGKVLQTYGMVNLDSQLAGLDPVQALETTAKILSQLLKQAHVKSSHCIISLPSSAVFTSVIELPVMSEKELGGALEFEARKYVPLPINEVILSWSVISQQTGGNQNILLTAVPKQIKERYVQLFELVGMGLEVIEIEALALIRALISGGEQNCVIIDIGAKATSLNLVKNGFLQLSRSISVGGDTITERLAQALGVTLSRAEQFKQDFGLSNSSFLPATIQPVFANIKAEVRQLVALYRAKGTAVDKLLFVGGGSVVPGVLDFFKDIGIPVEFGNPLQNIRYPEELASLVQRHGVRLSVAIGLAMRE